jgi:hypothetical protein
LDPSGSPVTIFIDFLGYIGDYPAVTAALDVLGHNTRAPCHLCSFVRQDRIGAGSLNYYGYTSSVHSRATSFCRWIDRTRSVRAVGNSQDLSLLGFKPDFDEKNYPLHALSVALRAARDNIPITSCGLPVVLGLFDPYRSAIVAPDHLLFGMAQDVLRAMLKHSKGLSNCGYTDQSCIQREQSRKADTSSECACSIFQLYGNFRHVCSASCCPRVL